MLNFDFLQESGNTYSTKGNTIWFSKANIFLFTENCPEKVCINDRSHLGRLKEILRDVKDCLHTFSEKTRNCFSADGRGIWTVNPKYNDWAAFHMLHFSVLKF